MAEDERAPKRWQAPSAAKRAVERYWLGYTVVWGGVAGSVMLTGLAEGWGDVELMALGVAFALGTVVPPIARPHASEADVPWYQRTATKMSAGVVSFALLMNYVCTPYFFEVLHMRYGFRATWVIEQNPIFLYLMTVAYFATYSLLINAGARLASGVAKPLRYGAMALVPFAVALFETLLNANPFMTRLFCFDDMRFMLTFGTFSYGCTFLFAMPVWWRVAETSREELPWPKLLGWIAAGIVGIGLTFAALRHGVAPHLTTIIPGAPATAPGGCLAPR